MSCPTTNPFTLTDDELLYLKGITMQLILHAMPDGAEMYKSYSEKFVKDTEKRLLTPVSHHYDMEAEIPLYMYEREINDPSVLEYIDILRKLNDQLSVNMFREYVTKLDRLRKDYLTKRNFSTMFGRSIDRDYNLRYSIDWKHIANTMGVKTNNTPSMLHYVTYYSPRQKDVDVDVNTKYFNIVDMIKGVVDGNSMYNISESNKPSWWTGLEYLPWNKRVPRYHFMVDGSPMTMSLSKTYKTISGLSTGSFDISFITTRNGLNILLQMVRTIRLPLRPLKPTLVETFDMFDPVNHKYKPRNEFVKMLMEFARTPIKLFY